VQLLWLLSLPLYIVIINIICNSFLCQTKNFLLDLWNANASCYTKEGQLCSNTTESHSSKQDVAPKGT